MNTTGPTLGVCYYPEHWPQSEWRHDARRMVECGITHVRIAEFAWSRIEPARDQFDWEWLDEAVSVLGDAGLKIIMCTPTATPPKWLVDEMPDMVAIDQDDKPRRWGSRRHYDFSHLGYRKEAARITEIVARRYGNSPHVVAWQTDNEYGCHDTTISYSVSARSGFQNWLAQKYQSPDALNRAWGNVFWSMEVSDFSEIELPNLTVTEPNPSQILDFRRYTSDRVVEFNRIQTKILRKLSPERDLVHNFMGRYLEFDHFDVADDLDIASWDSYPLGFLERFGRDDAWKNWYLRAGDPDFQAFHHDLYRGCGKGRMWVMEQQPGPVNWAAWNPDPHPGMVRLWSLEAFAHGAEVVSYFRWRQAPFAQEQFHAALNRPDGFADRGYEEAKQVAADIAGLPVQSNSRSDIALVFDYPSLWAVETQPQGVNFDGFDLVFDFYRALRKLGQNIDIVSTNDDLDGYKLIVVPQVLIPDEDFIDRLKAAKGQVILGPRCGSRTSSHQIPSTLPPGLFQEVLEIKVLRVESLRPGISVPVGHEGALQKWMEHLEVDSGVDVEHATLENAPVVVSNERFTYLAGWPDEPLLNSILMDCLCKAKVQITETGEDLRIRDNGNLRTIVNYGPKPVDAGHLISKNDKVLIGKRTLPVAGVTIVELG